MPSTRFETTAGWIAGRHADIASAIQRALIEGIRIPADDRDIRILEYPAGSFFPPPDRGPHYSVLEISMFSGRTAEAKGRLYAAMSRELAAFDLGEADLKIVIHDVPIENWGLRGKSVNPATIPFKINV